MCPVKLFLSNKKNNNWKNVFLSAKKFIRVVPYSFSHVRDALTENQQSLCDSLIDDY